MAWLSGWSRRKKVIITGTTAGAQTDFQIKIDITYDSDMKADFTDLRFTQTDGTTLIDFWLESKVDSTSAVVWIEVPSIPANPSTVNIYMYYGKSDASSASDGTNTFLLFDDFPGVSVDLTKWEGTTALGSVASSILTITGNGVDRRMNSIIDITLPAWIRFRWKRTNNTDDHVFGMFSVASFVSDDIEFYHMVSAKRVYTSSGGTRSSVNTDAPSAGFNNLDIKWQSGQVNWYENGSERTNSPKTNNVPSVVLPVGFRTIDNGLIYEFDYIFVRKYASPDPTYSTGSEENSGYWFRLQARNELQGIRGING